MTRIGVLLSGTGRTLENLHDEIIAERLRAQLVCVLSDRADVMGLVRAARFGIPHEVVDPAATWDRLRAYRCELVCLCGYLRKLDIPPDFDKRVLNIHPSLLPRHGGRGFYGHHVHQSVLNADDTESGCTVHYCNNEYDEGEILLQQRVPVLPNDTVDRLAARVFASECSAYPQAIRLWQERTP